MMQGQAGRTGREAAAADFPGLQDYSAQHAPRAPLLRESAVGVCGLVLETGLTCCWQGCRVWSGGVGCLRPALCRDVSAESLDIPTGEDFRVSDVPVSRSKDEETVLEKGSGRKSSGSVSALPSTGLTSCFQEQVKNHSGEDAEPSWNRLHLQHQEKPTTGETDSFTL
ncbi:large ribosomal subunit protein bL33m isoform 1-T1 [Dugong dugon]